MTSISSSSSASSVLSQALLQQIQKNRAEAFKKADTDGSGGLSLDEFKSLGTQSSQSAQESTAVSSAFTKMDTNGDGSLSLDELASGTDESNAISKLSDKLMNTLIQMLGGGQSGDQGADGASDTADASSAPPPPPKKVSADDFMSALDSNDDGSISQEEMTSFSSANGLDTSSISDLFTAMDSDGDGSISSDENQAFADKMNAGGPPPPPPQQVSSKSDSSNSSSTKTYDPLDTNKDGVVSIDELMAALNGTSGTTDTSATASNQTDSQSNATSMISELKTAVKTFLLALQEQQQKQVA